MATTLISNFSYYGKNPNFERDTVATKADLRAVIPTEQNKYDYGHIVFCKEDGRHYKFMYNYATPPKDSEKDAVTGWFKEFVTEGGSSDANVAAVDVGETVDDVAVEYATKGYVDSAISAAITTTLNTLV